MGDFPFPSSDHRLLYAGVTLARTGASQNRQSVSGYEFLGGVTIPTGTLFEGTEIGGLSGLVYDPSRSLYYAIADDRSPAARFYTLGIDLSDGELNEGDVAFQSVTQLLDANGQPFADGSLDPEGIALTGIGTLYISSEGDANTLVDPFVRQFSLQNGQQISELPIPAKYLPTADRSTGIRNNAAFESLTLSPDQRFLYTATENALFQDGPAASLETGSLSRILQFDLSTGLPVAETVYEVEAVPNEPVPADGFATNGLVELLALDNNGTFLALERAFSAGVGNTVKLYQVNAQGALDVFRIASLFRDEPVEVDGEILDPAPFEVDPTVIKTELLDFADDLGITPDNLEGIALGPVLPDGRQSLIVVSDNNFSTTQTTQFLALALEFQTIPAALPVLETAYTVDDALEFDPLNILLVNDDGFGAEGIEVMYNALLAAGHTVTLVAPKEQQSGQGTLINVDRIFQPTEVVEFAPGQWYVDGSPVLTTLAALDFILDDEAPDLVISGINEGENVGASIAISSGTVSAASTAIQRDIPAIAVSAGTVRDKNFQIDEEALAAAYDLSAKTVVNLVEQLQRTYGEDLLPEGVGLNVNIPAVVEKVEGVALTRLDETGTFDLFVDHIAPGVAGLVFAPGQPLTPDAITVADSEGQNFLANFITVSAIDGDWTASNNTRVQLQNRLAAAPETPAVTPLTILLTNDDGFDAEGIEVAYEALTEAGHTVILVGPKEQQSGTGTALDVDKILQPLEVVNVEGNKWFVDAGVRTTTWAGLDSVLRGERPDLVISGINEGENIGPGGAVSSGTVSAAVTALLRDVPAMAISAGVDFTDESGAATRTAYHAGADYLVTLIAQLQATQGDQADLLPSGIGLNINVPARFPEGVDGIQGTAFTNYDGVDPFIIDFGPISDTAAGLRFAPFELPAGEPVDPTSEGGQFLSGFITVTPLDGDWSAPALEQELVDQLLTAPEPELTGDSDDPAIWVHPTDPAKSVVLGTLKDGGLVSFDLQGNILETFRPADFGDIRYNNVDVVYGFTGMGMGMGGEVETDLAVLSDRQNDTLAILAIDPDTGTITDVTSPDIPETIFGVDDGEATAYGLATYTSPVTGRVYAFVTQASGNLVAQLELIPQVGPADEFFVTAEVVRTIKLPVPTGDPVDSQSEGLVIDQELGVLYVALENEVGILRFSAEPDGGNDFTLVQPIDREGLVPDIEGLSIYYGANGSGYLLVNSQGDSSYAVFTRDGTNEYLGNFVVGANGDIDQVNESDGLDVINVPLGPDFPNGLLVLQDGANDPQNPVQDDEQLENSSTNFKFVPWGSVANVFPNPLQIDTTSFDPRNPQVFSLVNGVGSGDVSQDAVMLWARSTFPGDVTFAYATDSSFSSILGTVTATVTDINQPVKVHITGLEAGTEYVYRVTDAAGDVETGRFVTAAPLGDRTGLTFGIAGDWQQAPPYPILTSAADLNLDFFVKLGDTIYADLETPATPGVSQARTLEQFRAKHSEALSPRLGLSATADLYKTTSIFATIDDHEIVDNFAGGAAPGESPDAPDIGSSPDPLFTDNVPFVNETQAYKDALQAYQEYHPIQNRVYDTPGDPRTDGKPQLYRAQNFGSDAALVVLDSRSFRDVQLPPVDLSNPAPFLVSTFDPSRTLLGRPQVELLKQDLLAAEENGVTWKFVVIPEPIQNFGVVNAEDRFEGYAAERTEILKFITDNDIDNVVFMAGDFHGTIVNNLTYQEGPGQAQVATNAFEVVTGPVAFFEGRFGPAVANISLAAGLLTQEQFNFYNALPIAPDPDSALNDRDDFIKQLLVTQTDLLGYDPVGLNTNLPQADGLIEATLLQGDYVAVHNYSWTEFDIAAETQVLTVTTYGIDAYREADVLTNPDAVLGLTPRIISQFEVTPQI
ncbi:MAG: phytase [Nodosilinea sp.]